jgi:pyruvyltransferase
MIVEHFTGEKVEFAPVDWKGKWISTGSVMHAVAEGDTVWGTGLISGTHKRIMPKANYAAVRGPLTRQVCGLEVEVFGDPALLLPLIYRPQFEKKHAIGIIPHYTDKTIIKNNHRLQSEGHVIDIQAPWRTVIDEILSCERIISSSLHGVIAAEAYGIPASWAHWGNGIIGGEFKFQDYFMGTRRKAQEYGKRIRPIENIAEIQAELLNALPWKKTP